MHSGAFAQANDWLWHALAWPGGVAFGCAIGVRYIVGYESLFHLARAYAGSAIWMLALILSHDRLASDSKE